MNLHAVRLKSRKSLRVLQDLACHLHLLLREVVILPSDEGIIMHDVTCNGRVFTDIGRIGYFLDFSMFSGRKSSVFHHGGLMISQCTFVTAYLETYKPTIDKINRHEILWYCFEKFHTIHDVEELRHSVD